MSATSQPRIVNGWTRRSGAGRDGHAGPVGLDDQGERAVIDDRKAEGRLVKVRAAAMSVTGTNATRGACASTPQMVCEIPSGSRPSRQTGDARQPQRPLPRG